jgi:hypothetical protein
MLRVKARREQNGTRLRAEGEVYHAMASILGIGLENAVGGGVIASCVHGI